MAVDLQKLKRKMRGVTGTRQVTRALQMVSAMKMRKSQELAAKSHVYRNALLDMLASFESAEMEPPEELLRPASTGEKILIVAFASDRGLCGPYNNNVIGFVQQFLAEDDTRDADIVSIGWKVGATLQRRGYPVISNSRRPAQVDRLAFLRKLGMDLLERWRSGEYKGISLLFSSLRGMTVLKPELVPWLPFHRREPEDKRHPLPPSEVNFIDEPTSLALYHAVIQRYLENSLLAALLDSEASEHVARMVAMDNATRNAEDLFKDLQLTYNKARQAKITQEICEIVGGANAIGKG